ncbi:MAG: hypothetical protein MUE31_05195 [Candidatus Nanopelagicales bacterium]|jgi:hypothetical protein|nr:hypothetical protein [Candidatus Nanopelagicales bacterium]
MPHGPLKIAADPANAGLLDEVRALVQTEASPEGRPDAYLCRGVPGHDAAHIVVVAELDDAVDQWDAAVPVQSLAGALWIPPGQDAAAAVAAWAALRMQTPTTPLSDLTDNNQRALRWSVAAATHVEHHTPGDEQIDEAEIRAWLEEQPQVRELGQAVDRLGADNAEAALAGAERFRAALASLDELGVMPPAPPQAAFEAALAEQLRQVQLSGLRRWRSSKARELSCRETATAGRELAADRLRQLIEVRRAELAAQRREEQSHSAAQQWLDTTVKALAELTLPVEPDFDKSPRSWTQDAPQPRRYILVNPEHSDAFASVAGVQVRALDVVLPDTALCLLVQSGFSLPALR